MKRFLAVFIALTAILPCFVAAASGGPDAFGYRWVDSNEPGGPSYNWINISTTGRRLTASSCDDCYEAVTLAQPFEFYGVPYTRMAVTSNGYVSFDMSSTYYPISATYTRFPDTSTPNAVIALLNADLYPASGGGVYFQDFAEYCVVMWDSVPDLGGTSYSSFELVLHYRKKEINMHFRKFGRTSTRTFRCGQENSTGTIGLDIFNVAPSMFPADNYSIRCRATPTATLPYFDNFELVTGDFELETGGWEQGTVTPPSPAAPPHTGSKCWATNLDGNYDNNCDWTFLAPHIDATGVRSPIIDFWHFYRSESGHDGGVVEVSEDEGSSWNIVDPEGGYPTAMTTGPLVGVNAFSGSSDGWEYASYDMSAYGESEFMVRFRFMSDASTNDLGWYIDDFGYHQKYGVLQGTVDLLYFVPDSGALVEIVDLGLSTRTDATGFFRFDTVAVGAHTLRLSRFHFVTRDAIPFTIERFDTTVLHLTLAPELYNETFELSNGDLVPNPAANGWEWGAPTAGPSGAFSGLKCWGTKLAGNYDNAADWTLTLMLPLYEIRWPAISFYQWYQFEEGFFGTLPDGGNIKVSADSGATWTLIEPVVGEYDGVVGTHNLFLGGQPAFGDANSGDFWHEVVFRLWEFAGNDFILIRWEIGTDASNRSRGWYIDDVRVADDSTAGIEEAETKLPTTFGISTYPNPFNSFCNISLFANEKGELQISDISGRIVKTMSVQRGPQSLIWDASDMPSGVYMLRLISGKNEAVRNITLVK